MINELKELIKKYNFSLLNPNDFVTTNSLYGKINFLCEKLEDTDWFIMTYFSLIKDNLEDYIVIVWFLRKYEPDLSKKLYELFYKKDNRLNFPYEYVLKYWEEDQKELEKNRIQEDLKKIERYEKWKEENREEYEKIILELNKIIEKF